MLNKLEVVHIKIELLQATLLQVQNVRNNTDPTSIAGTSTTNKREENEQFSKNLTL